MNQDDEILPALRSLGMLPDGANPPLVRLPGGVSSDVYRVDLPSGPVCVKKVLPKLNVSADWRAPVERVHSEAAWFRFADQIVSGRVPTVLAEDRAAHLFVMNYFDPATHPCWKNLLRDGIIDHAFAAKMGETIARIHRASAGSETVQNEFATHDFFMALRIDPYLLTAAKAHPDRADRIREIAHDLAQARIALMHGDLSPKNILAGPDGPIILDAETACYGDPAFDLAFCLNHLLLKCVWKPAHAKDYCASFAALRDTYLAMVDWGNAGTLEKRASALLSALLLARIDGKSPVEYLTAPRDLDFVRTAARDYLARPELTLDDIRQDWERRALAR
jgi:aminoglycoside phosphotransferase (APT) family kinase protein